MKRGGANAGKTQGRIVAQSRGAVVALVILSLAATQSACTGSTSPTTSPSTVTVVLTPTSASVPTGGEQVFTVAVSGEGSASASVTWSVNGIAGGNTTLGTIAATGPTTAAYTAPPVPPSPPGVTITAASVADPSKSASASVTITCAATNSISPASASVGLGQTQAYSASFCLAAGASAAWDVNGVAGGNAALGTILSTGPANATYTAPADLPPTNPVTIHATAPSGTTAAATVTVTSAVGVTVSPPAATLSPGQRASFSATVSNSSDATVTWSVNGIANGNASFGQVCQSGTNPCVAPPGPASGGIDFVAPASPPAMNPVILTATSHADPSQSSSATILISAVTGTVAVTVSPGYAFLAPSGGARSTQQFVATVTGATNSDVSWSVQSAVAGQGCAGAACGSIDANGLYAAPSVAPSPNAIAVIATSQADPTKSAAATIALMGGPVIEAILPSSVMAGAVEGFPLAVQGANFVAGTGTSASVILLNGAARSTTCGSASSCMTFLNPSDVQSDGTVSVEVQNPGNPGALSNPAPFVIAPFDVSSDTIALTAAQPAATGKDIIVVEPTTAAASSPINVDFVGFLTGGNTCGIQGSPLTITRPTSGSATVSICIHGNGLDPTFAYAFTGPGAAPGGTDIGITASSIPGLFPGMIELDLQISNATLPGVRALVISTPNYDRAVATGIMEVK